MFSKKVHKKRLSKFQRLSKLQDPLGENFTTTQFVLQQDQRLGSSAAPKVNTQGLLYEGKGSIEWRVSAPKILNRFRGKNVFDFVIRDPATNADGTVNEKRFLLPEPEEAVMVTQAMIDIELGQDVAEQAAVQRCLIAFPVNNAARARILYDIQEKWASERAGNYKMRTTLEDKFATAR